MSEFALVYTFERDAGMPMPQPDAVASALQGVVTPAECSGFDVYAPHPEHDRFDFFRDGAPPLVIVECRAHSLPALERCAGDARLQAALDHIACAPPGGHDVALGRWRAGIFRVECELAATPQQAAAAALALVVHYYGPVDDADAFVAHYVANHPPLLARLPAVRDVRCYVPVAAAPTGVAGLADLAADPAIIRNEVWFDSMDALLESLRAPVVAEMRADARAFARYGHATHYPMRRIRLAGAARSPDNGRALSASDRPRAFDEGST